LAQEPRLDRDTLGRGLVPRSGPTFQLAVASPSPTYLLGWNASLSVEDGPYQLVGAFAPDLPATDPLVVSLFRPSTDVVRLRLSAVNYAGESGASAPVQLTFPASLLPSAAAAILVP
jgi:hypothetical protein